MVVNIGSSSSRTQRLHIKCGTIKVAQKGSAYLY